jgi:CxxC motif-containing protein (DUF1111 family)
MTYIIHFILILLFFSASVQAQDLSKIAGELTSDLPGRAALQVNAPNITNEERRRTQLAGFGVFHGFFLSSNGLGPRFVNSSCGACHVGNGRGPVTFTRGGFGTGTTMVIKTSLPGLNTDGSPINVPGIGEQLQDHRVKGLSKTSIDLQWKIINGRYPDGSKYQLRKPKLSIRIKGRSTRKVITSLRMTPPVVGPGLLEAIPDSAILALSDPEDLNADGISGKPNYVIDERSSSYKIGRFGFKASHTTVEQQSAAALIHDIGISNEVFLDKTGIPEISSEALNLLVVYQKLGGVPQARNQDNSDVLAGKEIFKNISCSSCHHMSFQTESSTDPELDSQQIHPFTDLLLHNMGPRLADKRAEFSAKGSEWKTTPLWGLGFSPDLKDPNQRLVYLHDGRARSIEEAILWHGGEAKNSRNSFKNLNKVEREQLIAFLKSI